jgi:hypothetical protein
VDIWQPPFLPARFAILAGKKIWQIHFFSESAVLDPSVGF